MKSETSRSSPSAAIGFPPCTSNGSWSFVNQWTENGGFKQIGFVKYKVDQLHKRYQRTQTRTEHYEQLTVVIG